MAEAVTQLLGESEKVQMFVERSRVSLGRHSERAQPGGGGLRTPESAAVFGCGEAKLKMGGKQF